MWIRNLRFIFLRVSIWMLWITISECQVFPGRRVDGGIEQDPTVRTIIDCLNRCLGQPGGRCPGFDFDWRTSKCYVHTAATVCGTFSSVITTVHYRFTDCTPTTTTTTTQATPAQTIPIGGTTPPTTSEFPDFHIRNGTLLPTARTFGQCQAVCVASRFCQGFDYSFQGLCHIHTELTECNPLVPKLGVTHYRIRVTCGDTDPQGLCFNPVFQELPGESRPGGQLIATDVSFTQCQVLCRVRRVCKAVDWDAAQSSCYEHRTPGTSSPNPCCSHARKICLDGTTAIPGLPTSRPPTTGFGGASTSRPTVPTTTLPLENGKCPQQVQAFTNTFTRFGQLIDGITTAEECRDFCIENDTCAAVNFDGTTLTGPRCLFHSNDTYDPEESQINPCCVEYRKLQNCMKKRCWTMPLMDVSDETMISGVTVYEPVESLLNLGSNTTSPDVELEECDGVCAMEASFTLDTMTGAISPTTSIQASRSCDVTAAGAAVTTKDCDTMVLGYDNITHLQNVTITCRCTADSCNAFWIQVLQSCLAHYSFDCNVLDTTFAQRDGEEFGLQYSGTDQAKNWSAVFNGSNYVEVKSFMNSIFGSIGPSPNFERRPDFTLFFWFKFTAMEDRKMAIINNGLPGEATLDVYTEPMNDTHRNIVAEVMISGTLYNDSIMVPYDAWHYFSLRVLPSTMYEVNLDVGTNEEDIDNVIIQTELDISVTGTTIDTSRDPLTIGKRYIPQGQATNATDEFYVGLLDEIWMFGRGLTDLELQTLVESSYYPIRLDA